MILQHRLTDLKRYIETSLYNHSPTHKPDFTCLANRSEKFHAIDSNQRRYICRHVMSISNGPVQSCLLRIIVCRLVREQYVKAMSKDFARSGFDISK